MCVCVCCILLIEPIKNIIKDNERTSMNERNTLLYKNTSLILFSKGAHSLLWVWEIDGETYTQRGDFFWPFIFFLEPLVSTLAPPCQPYRQRRPWSACVSFARLSILWTDCLNLTTCSHITWSPSGYTPAQTAYLDTLPSPVY